MLNKYHVPEMNAPMILLNPGHLPVQERTKSLGLISLTKVLSSDMLNLISKYDVYNVGSCFVLHNFIEHMVFTFLLRRSFIARNLNT